MNAPTPARSIGASAEERALARLIEKKDPSYKD